MYGRCQRLLPEDVHRLSVTDQTDGVVVAAGGDAGPLQLLLHLWLSSLSLSPSPSSCWRGGRRRYSDGLRTANFLCHFFVLCGMI